MMAHVFIDGWLMFGFAAIALFQLRFWRNTRDRIFLFFALAFGMLAVNRVALALLQATEPTTYLYVVRLVAFCIILFAIFDKNRRGARDVSAPPDGRSPSGAPGAPSG